MKTLTVHGIKFNKYNVSTVSNKVRVYYSRNVWAKSAPDMPVATININAKDYGEQLSKIFSKVRNDTDLMTDYFETDTITYYEGSAMYDELDVLMQNWGK
jgi:hypothetical protein